MASKINRGFMFYFFILLGIVFGVVLVGVVIMIFVPTFTPFGVGCFREDISQKTVNAVVYSDLESTTPSDPEKIANHSIDNIKINASDCSVTIFKSNESHGINYSQFAVTVNISNFGFTSDEIKTSSINIKYYIDSKTLVIDIENPEGFKFLNSSSIEIQIPPQYSTDNINLEVSSKNIITLGDSETERNLHPTMLNLKSVKLKTDSSVLMTDYATIGGVSRGDCSIDAVKGATVNTVIKADNLNIKVGESTSNFNHELLLTGDLKIESDNSFINLGYFTCSNLFLKNSYGQIFFNKDISTNVFVDKDSNKCDYYFKSIFGNLTVGSYFDELMVEGGNFNIDEISGVTIMATTANINIDKISNLTKIKNISGSININSVNAPADIKSVDSLVILGAVKNDEGKIINNGINSRISIELTGSGKVDAYFNSFNYAGDLSSEILTQTGVINIYLVKNMDKDIQAETTSSLKYLGIDIQPKTGAWKLGEGKSLKINSKADITIVNR